MGKNRSISYNITGGSPNLMKNRRNYYRILQVQPDAPMEVIRASYRTQMRELKRHPDLGGSDEAAAILNEAYEILSNPVRRTAYDKDLLRRYIFTKPTPTDARKPIVPVLCPFCKLSLSREPRPGDTCTHCRTPVKSAEVKLSQPSGKRSLFRVKHSESIDYYSRWPGEAKKGMMIDLSPKGMRFVCEEQLLPKTVLKISSGLLDASGAVTNSQEKVCSGRKQYEIGVSFLAVNFDDSKGNFLSTSG
jgi:curved DNA-binding protein CbpA